MDCNMVGGCDGLQLGNRDGFSDGADDEGTLLGLVDGTKELGTIDGTAEGSSVGRTDGSSVGLWDGVVDGI